ncbi:STAS domain-containing protein [Actinokineospora diospyrosa]|uniref:Anti-sigma factor antagonist n=1 Tax=Actinokineospora diospyrosa TaxID=103728 RepID=A0ABT1IC40_9PSEU|nr:STAS domain-containing protein [Actinokineospora diospyrosa]MCP2270200.1 anti-sigma B factor antagonist [Actinokineospora diospyrosa]
MSTLFTVSVEQEPDRTTLHASGEIDMGTVSTLADALDTAQESGSAVVVVDLTEVTFLASAGLAALVAADQRARTTGGALVVVSPPAGAVHRAITVSSLDRVLTLAEDAVTADRQVRERRDT